MPLTPPFPFQPPEHKLTDKELVKLIRLDLEAELDAINLYESHLSNTDNEKAKKVLAHVIKEEKDHFELFMELLKDLDPQEKNIVEKNEYDDVINGKKSISNMLYLLTYKLNKCGQSNVADKINYLLKKI